MCGIAGLISVKNSYPEKLERYALQMATSLYHRGPDQSGLWADKANGVALAHRRLSIIDLSINGQQPMTRPYSPWVIVFNGEIYNHKELRSKLEADIPFTSTSDTEVLLAAICSWGIEKTLQRIRGMFAFCAWNKVTKELVLARDRMGEKPLYAGVAGEYLFFCSELKSLRSLDFFSKSICRNALASLLQTGYVPDHQCIFENVWKIPPGHYCSFKLNQSARQLDIAFLKRHTYEYWSLSNLCRTSACGLITDMTAAKEQLKALLRDTISEQLFADVPVGVFLSGGVDSSLVASIAAEVSNRTIQTFSIGFQNKQFDEAPIARRVASHINSEHFEYYVGDNDLQAVIPRLGSVYDEPFADPSQIPTLVVCEIAKRHVSVCLSGDGGDELFGGYNRYSITPAIYRRIEGLPQPIKALLGKVAGWNSLSRALGLIEPSLSKIIPGLPSRTAERINKIRKILNARSLFDAFISLHYYSEDPSFFMNHRYSQPDVFKKLEEESFLRNALLFDQTRYLPGDNLVKMDRASMSTSLEVRIPLLDKRVVEFSWLVADQLKINGNEKKLLLRQVLQDYLPAHITDRPKMGFSVPLNNWLRTDLKEWVSDTLDSVCSNTDYFSQSAIANLWQRHLQGKEDSAYQIWPILQFEQWRQAMKD